MPFTHHRTGHITRLLAIFAGVTAITVALAAPAFAAPVPPTLSSTQATFTVPSGTTSTLDTEALVGREPQGLDERHLRDPHRRRTQRDTLYLPGRRLPDRQAGWSEYLLLGHTSHPDDLRTAASADLDHCR